MIEATPPTGEVPEIPQSLLDALNAEDELAARSWWHALTAQDRAELSGVLVPLVETELTCGLFDEDTEPDEFGEVDDEYEYFANHINDPLSRYSGTPLGYWSIGEWAGFPVAALPLLTPLWPPYPSDAPYRPWKPGGRLRRSF